MSVRLSAHDGYPQCVPHPKSETKVKLSHFVSSMRTLVLVKCQRLCISYFVSNTEQKLITIDHILASVDNKPVSILYPGNPLL